MLEAYLESLPASASLPFGVKGSGSGVVGGSNSGAVSGSSAPAEFVSSSGDVIHEHTDGDTAVAGGAQHELPLPGEDAASRASAAVAAVHGEDLYCYIGFPPSSIA